MEGQEVTMLLRTRCTFDRQAVVSTALQGGGNITLVVYAGQPTPDPDPEDLISVEIGTAVVEFSLDRPVVDLPPDNPMKILLPAANGPAGWRGTLVFPAPSSGTRSAP